MISKKKENPIADEWKKLYAEQPDEIKEKLDALDKMKPKEYQLRVIKKAKPILKDGDIFILSPRENVYFYGKVLKANINHINNDTFVQGKNLVFIFKNKTKKPTIDDFKPDYSQLLIRPAIVDISYWNKGLFCNVGNIPLSEYENELDYGFLKISIKSNIYCKKDGTVLEKKPEMLGIFGVSTINGIASKIEKQLIINPDLLI
ncbi:MAG: immunity 26/phosphotriesterase HocA family protein [Halanaerobiales bacterium]|nr:immunity 26/phosphotriesterase HocA family protein [Halanaerobiales bacterium]